MHNNHGLFFGTLLSTHFSPLLLMSYPNRPLQLMAMPTSWSDDSMRTPGKLPCRVEGLAAWSLPSHRWNEPLLPFWSLQFEIPLSFITSYSGSNSDNDLKQLLALFPPHPAFNDSIEKHYYGPVANPVDHPSSDLPLSKPTWSTVAQ